MKRRASSCDSSSRQAQQPGSVHLYVSSVLPLSVAPSPRSNNHGGVLQEGIWYRAHAKVPTAVCVVCAGVRVVPFSTPSGPYDSNCWYD